MWEKLGQFVLKNRVILLVLLLAATGFMGYHTSKLQLSYDFSRAVPTDNAKYQEYLAFKQKFGEDGNMLVIGFETKDLFKENVFNEYRKLVENLKKVNKVEDVISVANSITLAKNDSSEKLKAVQIFPKGNLSQQDLDSGKAKFLNLPFYRGFLFNPETNAYLTGVHINKEAMASKLRTTVVNNIVAAGDTFSKATGIEMHYSGLPLIRTQVADRIAFEMRWLLIGSLILSAVILMVFFRSVSATVMSLLVVIFGVIWATGTMELFHYKITLLNALIPPLVVVIGIPNCIYFLNKYHLSWRDTKDKHAALIQMIAKMGIVTLFCNIAAAIGFAVFALTKSPLLKEFGVVAGISIMVIFVISFIFIPTVLSFLPAPKPKHVRYLDNRWLLSLLDKLEDWSLDHRKTIYAFTAIISVVSILGMLRLKSEGFIVDDLPKTDRIYKDLKYFESNFNGVMPLEIAVDTKRKNGFRAKPLEILGAMDSLSVYIDSRPEMAKPLSIVEGMKFARQAYYDGDSSYYSLPNSFDVAFLSGYLNMKADSGSAKPQNTFTKLVSSFMDSSKQVARISVNMKDVGSAELPKIISDVKQKANQYFDSSKYSVQFTGSSVTFLEGSSFIINGLKESIMWAFLLIALCMLYLFKSLRILICSLIPNIIPLLITAGVMGWLGVRLKPSTVLVFSVALGIAIDITIRFLVNYKQEKDEDKEKDYRQLVIDTIHTTGISIIYTSLVLIAGFVIFCFSGFGGTKSLGWLISLTLVAATFTNLILLPALLISTTKKKDNELKKVV
ncbi:efflux RND transporter permease subunit [Pinibacter soli]|uniref:Efflux RND transporter permease subunit n=1 Tax=Pinibacter soli TaxID=3044211 RepID=A0ABT6R790_9BACT|nr:efflux RND transporter permease subunit [Pinibacter soli]MDI3318431.1 efflux RND transporter permease subunit [Pinibacter soli]